MNKDKCSIRRYAEYPMSAPGDNNKICYAPDFGFPIYHLKVAPYSVCKVPPPSYHKLSPQHTRSCAAGIAQPSIEAISSYKLQLCWNQPGPRVL